MRQVVVVGAGSAGLAAASALRRRGIDPVVLEKGARAGASWWGRHEDLRLNTVRASSGLAGLPIPAAAGRWVSRADYARYLAAYARHEGLDVRTGVAVHRLDRDAATWWVQTSDGTIAADHVVVATGHDRVPVVPDWSGAAEFTGRLAHVSEIRSPGSLAGHRVVVAGAGNSGIEIAGRLIDAGVDRLWLSARSLPNILPREVLGMPVQPAAVALGVLPERARDRAARWVSRVAFGDLAPFGLPAPPDGPFERMRTTGVTAAVDQGFVAHLKAGRAQVVPPIERFSTRCVVLRDGRALDADTVVAATGFQAGLESLVGDLHVLDAAGLPDAAAAAALGLWFVGFHPAVAGTLRQHPGEGRKVARAIARRSATPASPTVPSRATRPAP